MRLKQFYVKPLLGVLAVSFVFSVLESRAYDSELGGTTAKRFGLSSESVRQDTSEDAQVSVPSRETPRQRPEKQAQGLNGATLETNTNLDHKARGLTPADEWRRMFPRR